jgi:uncharacterized protein (DUF1330 family)/transposase
MEIIRMSKKELYKSELIAQVINKKITQVKASEELGISLRQTKRLCKKYKEEGPEGLAHKNRGRCSEKKMSPSICSEILELIKSHYIDFGPQLIQEQLETRHALVVSREWIRLLMINEGLWEVKKRKKLEYHQRRNRRSREGELIQIDGSPHAWFEDRASRCCLLNMVDDATGKIMEMRFVEEECLEGYFEGIKRYIRRHGRPIAIYSDRHTIFKSPVSEDKGNLTQFGRAMKELEIELIYANSPQAKGRVERVHGTLQDRLIKLMRLENVSSIKEGNEFLEKFREEYNQQFGRKPLSKENAHRNASELNLEMILCKKEKRKVTNSLEVHYKQKTYRLIALGNARRIKGKAVEVIESKDRVIIEFEGNEYDYTIFEDQPYKETIKDRKKLDAFLDKKKPMTAVQRHRKKLAINF